MRLSRRQVSEFKEKANRPRRIECFSHPSFTQASCQLAANVARALLYKSHATIRRRSGAPRDGRDFTQVGACHEGENHSSATRGYA